MISSQPFPQMRQPEPPQLKQETSTSAPGSTNGKKEGRSRTRCSGPKRALANSSSVPFMSARESPSSTASPSTWWKIGKCVGSGTSWR